MGKVYKIISYIGTLLKLFEVYKKEKIKEKKKKKNCVLEIQSLHLKSCFTNMISVSSRQFSRILSEIVLNLNNNY